MQKAYNLQASSYLMATFQVQVILELRDLIDNYLYSKGFILSTSIMEISARGGPCAENSLLSEVSLQMQAETFQGKSVTHVYLQHKSARVLH